MKIFFSLIFVFSFVSSIYAFQLNSVKVSDLELADIEIIQPIAVKASKKSAIKNENEQVNLWMQIRSFNAVNETAADDSFARIDVIVKKVFANDYSVRTIVDSDYEWSDIRKGSNNEYHLSGHGINLTMNKWNGNYIISGNVYDEQQHKYVDIMLNKWSNDDKFSYYMNDFRLNLTIDDRSIDGYFNTNDYSKKTVAAIVSFILVLHDQKFKAMPSVVSRTMSIKTTKAMPSVVTRRYAHQTTNTEEPVKK